MARPPCPNCNKTNYGTVLVCDKCGRRACSLCMTRGTNCTACRKGYFNAVK